MDLVRLLMLQMVVMDTIGQFGDIFSGGLPKNAAWYVDGTYGGNSFRSRLKPKNYSGLNTMYKTLGVGIAVSATVYGIVSAVGLGDTVDRKSNNWGKEFFYGK